MDAAEYYKEWYRVNHEAQRARSLAYYQRTRPQQTEYKPRATPVISKIKMIETLGEFGEVIEVYDSIAACEADTGITSQTIRNSINKNRVTKHGYKFERVF